MDEMRTQLSLLMGSIKDDAAEKGRHFTDYDVCKLYLTGLCPHDLFANTRLYLGPCEKIHSDELREIYLKSREKKRYGYEEEVIKIIQPLIDDSDRKIGRGQVRCEEDSKASAEESDELKKINSSIDEKMKNAELLGNSGDVEGSMRLMAEIEILNSRKAVLEDPNSAEYSFNQKLKPCEVCGALLSATDSDRRLSEHFSGKIHIGFQMLRDALKSLREYLQAAPTEDANIRHRNSDHHRSISTERSYRESKSTTRRESSRSDRHRDRYSYTTSTNTHYSHHPSSYSRYRSDYRRSSRDRSEYYKSKYHKHRYRTSRSRSRSRSRGRIEYKNGR